MGRPADPLTPYRVRPHVTNGYVYASTQISFLDPDTGKKKYRYVHWGSLDDGLRFIPGNSFWLASPEERALLQFPDDWDLSAVGDFTRPGHPGRRPVCEGEPRNLLYGDIWLLERIAEKTGIRQDLEVVFRGDSELVDDILTLAMFPHVTGFTYDRVVRWQRIAKTPSSRELTPSAITTLTQAITERDRAALLKLRSARMGKGEFCAIDSTSGTRETPTDIRRGKDGLPSPRTSEVVVYNLANHMPVHYMTFPGDIPDSRILDVILPELDRAGFKNPILVTARGCETIRDLDKYIRRGQPLITPAKTSQLAVKNAIRALGPFRDKPEAMDVDRGAGVYHAQFDVEHKAKGEGAAVRPADRLKVNLYFDPVQRSAELFQMYGDLKDQEAALRQLVDGGVALGDFDQVRLENGYHTIDYDPVTKAIKGFKRDERKVERETMMSGFFSIITHKLELDAMETHRVCQLRDEQEKCFRQMRGRTGSDKRRNWSEAGKTGRPLILFVSLILGSHLRHVWSATDLRKLFPSYLEVLDEMRSIRYIEHTNGAKAITPFVGAQVAICEAFGIPIPKGCAPSHASRQEPQKRRGRPPKRKVEGDF